MHISGEIEIRSVVRGASKDLSGVFHHTVRDDRQAIADPRDTFGHIARQRRHPFHQADRRLFEGIDDGVHLNEQRRTARLVSFAPGGLNRAKQQQRERKRSSSLALCPRCEGGRETTEEGVTSKQTVEVKRS